MTVQAIGSTWIESSTRSSDSDPAETALVARGGAGRLAGQAGQAAVVVVVGASLERKTNAAAAGARGGGVCSVAAHLVCR